MSLANALGSLARVSLGLGIAGSIGSVSLYNVDPGHRAVMFSRFGGGIQDYVVGEGTHFRIPWVQVPYFFDCRTRPRSITTQTGSKDLQTVSLVLRVLHKPREDALPTIYTNLGVDYDERVLPSIGNEVLKAIVAQFDASELITQREHVSRQIRKSLTERAAQYGIVLDDVSITHLSFSKEFTTAIERKQVAQQEAERSKFVVQKAEQERKAAVVRAEGESEAAELISTAISEAGTGLVALRKIEGAREIAATLARSRNVVYLPGGSDGGSGGQGGQGGPGLLLNIQG